MKAGVFISKEYINWRVKNLSVNASNVELALWYFLDFRNATARPAQEKIAEFCNMSLRSVQRGVTELISFNIISRTHKKSEGKKQYFHNEYLFLNFKNNMMDVPNIHLSDNEIDTIIDNFIRKRGQ